ncbi:MAG: hypothetical protein WC764_03660 [Candidatus Paceibacterota bacterium]|jgi:hypothetical protein
MANIEGNNQSETKWAIWGPLVNGVETFIRDGHLDDIKPELPKEQQGYLSHIGLLMLDYQPVVDKGETEEEKRASASMQRYTKVIADIFQKENHKISAEELSELKTALAELRESLRELVSTPNG